MKPSPRGNVASYEKDLAVVRAIVDGSLDAWHKFLKTYTGLVYSVVRRHLVAEDEDEVRSVYVDVLKRLYDSDIAKFDGRSPLSLWLSLYSRGRAVDYLRARYGRQRDPKGLEQLSETDREVFRVYYVDAMSLDVTMHTLDWLGHRLTPNELLESILRIERSVDRRVLRRLDEDRSTRRNGNPSRRLLKYLAQARADYEERVYETATDRGISEEDIERKLEQLRTLITTLTPEERRVVEMRFDKGMRAKEISNALRLSGQRRVYTIIERVVRRLRSEMDRGGGNGRPAAER
ncbi:MAG: sigma-70 family RNA polymerase sigma factor [Candidatus Krumholzibacteriia bacterium]